ncbi:hypothetical protein FHY35_000230 [Xanthomonas arboricola]|uniref:hypothetical protein n=1 Tax=Xanthomonas arboricola TaxID=56448 RepID=UPI00141B5141|nr:hypothetical protein [Xanthomonas arboricola]NIJ83275.1 hypothetical protein [Xanthomonas arboricola]
MPANAWPPALVSDALRIARARVIARCVSAALPFERIPAGHQAICAYSVADYGAISTLAITCVRTCVPGIGAPGLRNGTRQYASVINKPSNRQFGRQWKMPLHAPHVAPYPQTVRQ